MMSLENPSFRSHQARFLRKCFLLLNVSIFLKKKYLSNIRMTYQKVDNLLVNNRFVDDSLIVSSL